MYINNKSVLRSSSLEEANVNARVGLEFIIYRFVISGQS